MIPLLILLSIIIWASIVIVYFRVDIHKWLERHSDIPDRLRARRERSEARKAQGKKP
ncbi:hypothetical protein AOE01nite_01330 [Acetobacter oeni]|uniref:Uncharacterized protein n=1 Tax=Acetobacter oeni TaxID=304077 RepID=A0A511XG39_9PROT|nr:hypothetical protein AA21952_0428 [Acetobacter oeni LMG 21952]GEN61909.1 hypothetical protein AOE01nite_01330 [Acetobacter oeni]